MCCQQDETIKHLFFQCRFDRSIWSCIQVASDLYPPTSVANIFGNWLHDIDHRFRTLIVWSLWLCRNDKVFNDKNCSLLQVIYKCTYTLRSWSALHKVVNRDLFMEVCTRLDVTARNTFSQHGWQHNLRIGLPTVAWAFTQLLIIDMYNAFFNLHRSCVLSDLDGCVHLVMQRPDVIACFRVIKAPIIKKKGET